MFETENKRYQKFIQQKRSKKPGIPASSLFILLAIHQSQNDCRFWFHRVWSRKLAWIFPDRCRCIFRTTRNLTNTRSKTLLGRNHVSRTEIHVHDVDSPRFDQPSNFHPQLIKCRAQHFNPSHDFDSLEAFFGPKLKTRQACRGSFWKYPTKMLGS